MCKSCGPGQCRDAPTESLPLKIECPVCDGLSCDECGDGYFELTQCPKMELNREIMDLIEDSELAKKGLMPVRGGTLDQSSWFLKSAQVLWAEETRIENEKMGY